MKTRAILFLFLALTAGIFNSCKDDEVLTTNFDVILTQDFVVNNVNDTLFARDTIVDASAQSGDIEKYKDNIQDVSLTKVAYLLTSFTGDSLQTLISGAIKIADQSGGNQNNLTSMSNVNLKSLLNNETNLTINQGAMTLLGGLVKNSPHKFKVSASGAVNKKPLNFTIRLRFYLQVKAKVV